MEMEQSEIALSNIELKPNTIISRNNSFATMVLDDELVCIDESTGNSFGLNFTGKMIWDLLEIPLALHELISHISLEFQEEQETISNDIQNFLAALVTLKIILISS